MWKFLEAQERLIMAKAKALQPVACELIFQAFDQEDATTLELREEGHVFSRHFKNYCVSRNPTVGLQASVAAADVAASQHSHISSNYIPRNEVQETVGSEQPEHRVAAVAMDATTTCQPDLRQTLTSHWQPSGQAIWTGGVESDGFPCNDTETLAMNQFPETGMNSEVQTMGSTADIGWEYAPWEQW